MKENCLDGLGGSGMATDTTASEEFFVSCECTHQMKPRKDFNRVVTEKGMALDSDDKRRRVSSRRGSMERGRLLRKG